MLKKIKRNIARHIINWRGWTTNRKIIVFESDDWGSVRMSSKKNLSTLSDYGVKVQNCHYMQNDALASEEDLSLLFHLLSSHKDVNGNSPLITANVIMANPDFKKIKEASFDKYYYELFTETLKKYPKHKKSFELWKDGINEKLFYPQFHGREHLQVGRWMTYLKNLDSETRKAFELDIFGLSTTVTNENRRSYMAAYDWDNEKDREFILNSISDGLSLFKKIFGFNSISSIAPNYIWDDDVEKTLNEHQVRFIQGSSIQKSPDSTNKCYKKVRHYTGQKNEHSQTYLVRNCKFEPSSNPEYDWVDRCLKDIKNAFLWNKPALIETHRVNFIGFINPKNRDKNLKKLDELLKRIQNIWPDVEFLSTEQLGKVIASNE